MAEVKQYKFKPFKIPMAGEPDNDKTFLLWARFDLSPYAEVIRGIQGVRHVYDFEYELRIVIGRMFTKKEIKAQIRTLLDSPDSDIQAKIEILQHQTRILDGLGYSMLLSQMDTIIRISNKIKLEVHKELSNTEAPS